MAGHHRITIGIETEMEAIQLLKLVETFKSDLIGVYYDIGNMVSMGVSVEDEIKLLGKRIVGVHVKDRLRGGKSVPLGKGDAPFKKVFAALKEIGYHKPYIIQGARSEETDDITLNTEYYKYVWTLLEPIYHG